MSAVKDLAGFLSPGAQFSSTNYDQLLLGWSTLPLQTGLSFNADGIKYSGAAAAARQKIIDDFGWTIEDGGQL